MINNKNLNLAAFFNDDQLDVDTEQQPPPFVPPKPLDEHKLSSYATGIVRKSRKDKEKEAADAKKKEEEERAAQAYAEFLDDFEGADAKRKASTTTFVRSGQAPLGHREHAPDPANGSKSSALEHHSNRLQDEIANMAAASSASSSKPKGKRAMDAFLEEIKRYDSISIRLHPRWTHPYVHGVTLFSEIKRNAKPSFLVMLTGALLLH
jgi:U2-associated protein SR140